MTTQFPPSRIVRRADPQRMRVADVTADTFWFAGCQFLRQQDCVGFFFPVAGSGATKARPFGPDAMVWVGDARDASWQDSGRTDRDWATGRSDSRPRPVTMPIDDDTTPVGPMVARISGL